MPHDTRPGQGELSSEIDQGLLLRRIAGELAALRDDRARMEEVMQKQTIEIKRLATETRRARARMDDLQNKLVAHIDWARRAWQAWVSTP
jgi:predicted  nucleic acid-binding Zn-ribbon protein